MNFDSRTGEISGVPGIGDIGTSPGIVISVSDNKATVSLEAFTVTVVPLSNRPPTIAGAPSTTAIVGQAYVFQASGADLDADRLVYDIVGKPRWAEFDTATGRLQGTPTNADIGSTGAISIGVSDGRERASLAAFSILVQPIVPPAPAPSAPSSGPSSGTGSTPSSPASPAPLPAGTQGPGSPAQPPSPSPPQPPTSADPVSTTASPPESARPNRAPLLSGAAPPSARAGSPYSFRPTATDPDGDRLVFSISNRPAWAAFDAATGTLSGTPARSDVGLASNVVIAASDGDATTFLPAFSIRVEADNRAPSISGSPTTSITVGAAYSFVPAATDADGDRLTFSILNRPAWASFDPASGRLAGTPAASNVGTTTGVVITASDGISSTQLPAFDLRVVASNRAPVISGIAPTAVDAGRAYSFSPSAVDADGDPLTFTISNRPNWASFDTRSGRLSGTPAATDVGTFTAIGISVSDGRATDSLQPFTITVRAGTTSPVTLEWAPPTTNSDGSPLTDLAGYRLRYGTSASSLDRSVDIPNGGLTSYVVEGLAPGVWYFVLRAYNRRGAEGLPSNLTSTAVN